MSDNRKAKFARLAAEQAANRRVLEERAKPQEPAAAAEPENQTCPRCGQVLPPN